MESASVSTELDAKGLKLWEAGLYAGGCQLIGWALEQVWPQGLAGAAVSCSYTNCTSKIEFWKGSYIGCT